LTRERSLPLIPKYFDLLVLLIERRHTAVSRAEIFDRVWTDVVVSDGALSQAIRTLRRTLGDDSREPQYIRTVSRHGYSFVFKEVVEEWDDAPAAALPAPVEPARVIDAQAAEVEALIDRLLAEGDAATDEDRRDAAQQLHAIGTSIAMARLLARPRHAPGLALLRDTRWDVDGAGAVPLLGRPGGVAAAWYLIRLRMRDAFILAERRAVSAALGAALAGVVAGGAGGFVLASDAPFTIVPVLAMLGAISGGAGAAGIAAAIGAAEAIARSRRALAIISAAAIGGLLTGIVAQLAVRSTVRALFGLAVDQVGGPFMGLLLGAATGAGYALTTRRPGGGGMASPHGLARVRTAIVVGLCTAAAGLLLAVTGHPMVGGLINEIAQASGSSPLTRTPLADLYTEPSFPRFTQTLLAMFESGLFGIGLAAGLTRRPRH
jgi:DNA-binding winged helix-turn-helix (wHTH) protein